MKRKSIIRNYYRFNVFLMTTWICILFSPILAQDTIHPLKMNLPASGFKRPNPENFRVTLNNRLVAYIVEDHTVPLVSVTALVRAGTIDDNKQGSAEVLKHVFSNGLKMMGADYQVEIGLEITKISMTVTAEDAWQAVKLLAAILMNPNISTKSIEALQPKKSQKASPSELATGKGGPVLYEGSLTTAVERFNAMLFAKHPDGAKASKDDYTKLTVADVSHFHRTFFVPGNVVLALSGDFTSETAKSELSVNFNNWQAAPMPKHCKIPKVKTAKKRQIYTYPANKLQAWVVLGHELPEVPLRDQAALQVMNYILGGGHFDTRLFRATRDRRGLTNDDSGFLEPNWYGPGSYNFRTYGRPEVIHLLVELTLKEIERIRTEEVSEEELSIAQNALADGVFQMQFENGYNSSYICRRVAAVW